MDLNKYIVTNNTNKPFHSNGYAQIAVGNRVGSAGNISFAKRQEIDRNRRLIYGYNRSAIGNSYGALRAKPVLPRDNPSIAITPMLQQHNSLNSNPPTQHYNPYA